MRQPLLISAHWIGALVISKQASSTSNLTENSLVSNRYYPAPTTEMLDVMISSAVDSSSATPTSKSQPQPPPSMAKVQNFDEWVSNQQQKKLLRTKQLQHMMDQGSIITGRSMATNNTMLTDEMNEDQMALRRTQKHSLVHRNMYQQGSEPRKLLPQPLSRTKPPLRRPTYNVSTTASTADRKSVV